MRHLARELAGQAVLDGAAGLAVHRLAVPPLLPADQIDSYIAGLILLAAAPCTAMVFVWSNLSGGDPNFTLSQVALNDAIMIVAFAPIVGLLLGLSSITVPWDTLLLSVVLYIVVPVIVAQVVAPVVAGAGGGAALARAPVRCIRCRWWRCWRRWCCCSGSRGANPDAAAGDPAAGGADRHPGLFQCRPGLLFNRQCGSAHSRRRPFGVDRREQLLRAGGRSGDRPVRIPVTGRRWRRWSACWWRCR